MTSIISEHSSKAAMASQILSILGSMQEELSSISKSVVDVRDSLFDLSIKSEVLEYKCRNAETLVEGYNFPDKPVAR